MEQIRVGQQAGQRGMSSGLIHIHDLMRLASEVRASDVHLKTGSSPVLRVNGTLRARDDYEALRREDLERFFGQVTSPAQREAFAHAKELDLSYGLTGVGRFRINVGRQRGTLTMVLRRLIPEVPELRDLHLPAVCAQMLMQPQGLVLVTGATGSGKSTTLAAMVKYLNDRVARHIITIEDPIEYLFYDKRCFITQRELGDDTLSFADALKRALRQDPDVVVVGELLDLETITGAVTAAETGHLVLSTLCTTGAAQTVDRLVDVFPPHKQQCIRVQLANTLTGIISQTLVPTTDGRGRVAAAEVMVASPEIRALIREGHTAGISAAIEAGQDLGMQTLDQSLLSLHQRGLVTAESILARAKAPQLLQMQMQEPALH